MLNRSSPSPWRLGIPLSVLRSFQVICSRNPDTLDNFPGIPVVAGNLQHRVTKVLCTDRVRKNIRGNESALVSILGQQSPNVENLNLFSDALIIALPKNPDRIKVMRNCGIRST